MNWIDITVLVVLALAVFWGFRTGLIGMLVPLAVILLGLAFGGRAIGPLGSLFSFISQNENVQTALGYAAFFLLLVIGAVILGNLLRAVITKIPLTGTVNNLAGAVVGLLIGCVLLSGILTGLQKFPVGGLDEAIEDSASGTFLADRFDAVARGVGLIPRAWDQ